MEDPRVYNRIPSRIISFTYLATVKMHRRNVYTETSHVKCSFYNVGDVQLQILTAHVLFISFLFCSTYIIIMIYYLKIKVCGIYSKV